MGAFRIPTIGTVIKLNEDWTVPIIQESRNWEFLKRQGKIGERVSNRDVHLVTFPSGSALIVDRVYIKRGAAGFDSITFRLMKTNSKPFRSGRFWVRLQDANKMQGETSVPGDDVIVDRTAFTMLDKAFNPILYVVMGNNAVWIERKDNGDENLLKYIQELGRRLPRSDFWFYRLVLIEDEFVFDLSVTASSYSTQEIDEREARRLLFFRTESEARLGITKDLMEEVA